MKSKMPGNKKKLIQEENDITEKNDRKDSLKQISENDFSIMGKSNNMRDSIFKLASMVPEPENDYLLDYIMFRHKSKRDKSRFCDFFKELSEPKDLFKIEESKVTENPKVQTPMNPLTQNLRFNTYEKMPNVFSPNVAFNEMNYSGGENKFDSNHFSSSDSAQNDFTFYGRHGNSFSSKSTNTNSNTNNSNKRNSNSPGSLENNNVINFPGGDNTNNDINSIYNNSNNKTIINYIEKDKEFDPRVDINKVLSLEDRRSTIMIKNIPNKFTKEKLLGLIDKNFEGAYDLFIMPKDGNKNRNFGYAFVNFISSYYLPYFYYMFNGKKWTDTNSKKICEITYSKIQGRNELISHYPNKIIFFNDILEMKTGNKFFIPKEYLMLFKQLFPNHLVEENNFGFFTNMPFIF